jgi:excisionase family DNA binding protein
MFRSSVPIKEMSNENSNGETGERLLSVKDTAQMLGVSGRTVWRMIADGQLTPVRIRRCTRLFFADVVRLLKGGNNESV